MSAGISVIGLFVVICVVGIVVTLLAVLVKSSYKSAPPPADLTDEQIADLARGGNKITAIKYYRQLHGVGLKEAKDAVEKMVP